MNYKRWWPWLLIAAAVIAFAFVVEGFMQWFVHQRPERRECIVAVAENPEVLDMFGKPTRMEYVKQKSSRGVTADGRSWGKVGLRVEGPKREAGLIVEWRRDEGDTLVSVVRIRMERGWSGDSVIWESAQR